MNLATIKDMKLLFILIFSTGLVLGQVTEDLIPYRSGDKWGYSTREKVLVIPAQYDQALPFYKNLAVVTKGDECALIDKRHKVVLPFAKQILRPIIDSFYIKEVSEDTTTLQGVIDIHNKVILPVVYQSIAPIYGGLQVKKNGKYGICSYEGKVKIPPLSDAEIECHNEKVCTLTQDTLKALFSLDGKPLTPFKYTHIAGFEQGLVRVTFKGRHGFIDMRGKEVIPLVYEYANSFSEGYTVVGKGGKYGLIDTLGKFHIQAKYDYLEILYSGLARAILNRMEALVDYSGKELTPFDYDGIETLAKRFIIVNKDNKYALMNAKGELLTGFEFDKMYFVMVYKSNVSEYWERESHSNEGYIPVLKDEKWGMIDVSGKTILEAKFEHVLAFNHHLALVCKDKLWAVVDSKGNFKTDFIYTSLEPYISYKNRFLIIYQRNEKLGLMDVEGKEITAALYNYINPMNDGYCTVMQQRKIGLIDFEGKVILPVKYDKIKAYAYPDSWYRSIFNDRFALVRINGKEGFVSQEGVEYFE